LTNYKQENLVFYYNCLSTAHH